MNALIVMFDSLNRNYLPPYGCKETVAPNFARLAEKTVTFENSYVCSMPCMPARRDLHTARPNFLHTPWSCLQPWDDSVPEMLSAHGVSTHIVTDHYHYLEDGGHGYLQRYDTYECFRGHEGDPWKGQVAPPDIPPNINGKGRDQDWVNRQFMQQEEEFPQHRTFEAGLDFLRRNEGEDNWLLQIETFDPHEPFVSPEDCQALYASAGEEPIFDWPGYANVTESPEEVQRAKDNYKALLSFCDRQLGRVLDEMDRQNLWENTMLIVCADHGFLLGEHDRWAKNIPTLWNEIARTPFFVWDPRSGANGERRNTLVQPMLDIGPTLLNAFGLSPTPDMTGKDLTVPLKEDTEVRKAAIFGYYGYPVNVTNGEYVYMRNIEHPETELPLYCWTTNSMRDRWSPEGFKQVEMSPPLPFTKGMPVPRFTSSGAHPFDGPSKLFNVRTDPGQLNELTEPETETLMISLLKDSLQEAHAPEEVTQRLGLSGQETL
jgi:arylsulfatase A-like enzyme